MTARALIRRLMEGDLNLDAQLKVQLYIIQQKEDAEPQPITVDGISSRTAGSTKDGAYLVLDTAPIIIEAQYNVKED